MSVITTFSKEYIRLQIYRVCNKACTVAPKSRNTILARDRENVVSNVPIYKNFPMIFQNTARPSHTTRSVTPLKKVFFWLFKYTFCKRVSDERFSRLYTRRSTGTSFEPNEKSLRTVDYSRCSYRKTHNLLLFPRVDRPLAGRPRRKSLFRTRRASFSARRVYTTTTKTDLAR